MSTWVFLSVGRTFNDEQEQFVVAVEELLQAHGFKPQTVGRNYFSNQQPLKTVTELMDKCAGAVIVALERTHVREAIDKRGSPAETVLQAINLATVWNQIEAAMAYSLGLPLLVLVEDGLRSEGLLETGYDWYVNWVNLKRPVLDSREFLGVFEDWKARVEAVATAKALEAAHEAAQGPAGAQPGQAAAQGPDLLVAARSALLECRAFETQSELSALFFDSRVRPFENRLRDCSSYMERVDMLIDRLQDQHNLKGENALALFLQVLSERLHPEDACRQRLADLAWRLELEKGER
jgi:hypothetical protein